MKYEKETDEEPEKGRRKLLNTSKLTVGTYYLAPYASTEQHVRDLAQCGIDVVINMRNDRAALELPAMKAEYTFLNWISVRLPC